MPSRPISLTDDEMTAILAASQPLEPDDRVPFLEAVVAAVARLAVRGPGSTFRIIRETQRAHFHPPLEAAGSGAGSPGVSKYSRPGYGRQTA